MEGKSKLQNTGANSRHTPYAIRHTRGFTLLLSALISSLVLAIGVSIFEISRKQVTLSSIGRESQFAFYTADTGAECALYLDVRGKYFSTDRPVADPVCAEETFAITGNPADNPRTMGFQFEPYGKCAIATVKKCDIDECLGYPNTHTIIRVDGYNLDCASRATSPRALQRSVELRY